MSGWTIIEHLKPSELESRYKLCSDAREKTHWQVIMLAANGLSPKEIAQIVKYGLRWVTRLIQRYNEQGAAGLSDKRKRNRSSKLLSDELMLELERDLSKPPPDGGLWTSPKVALWMSSKLSRPINKQTAWLYFGYFKQRLKVPRPHNPLSDPTLVTEFKKKFSPSDTRSSGSIGVNAS